MSPELLELHGNSRTAGCRTKRQRAVVLLCWFRGTGPQAFLVEAGGDAGTLESPSTEEEDGGVAGMPEVFIYFFDDILCLAWMVKVFTPPPPTYTYFCLSLKKK